MSGISGMSVMSFLAHPHSLYLLARLQTLLPASAAVSLSWEYLLLAPAAFPSLFQGWTCIPSPIKATTHVQLPPVPPHTKNATGI